MLFQKVQGKFCGEFSPLAIALDQRAWKIIHSKKTASSFFVKQRVKSLGFKSSLLLDLSGAKPSHYQVSAAELTWEENFQV